MSDHIITGKLSTVVSLTYTDCHLDHGKWKTQPSGVISQGTDQQLFVGQNRDASVQPACGWCKYTANDGSVFTFHFEDNKSDDNYCWTTIENLSGPWSVDTPDYPKGGKTFTVTYKILQKANTFADVPVSPEEILNASKCDSYSIQQIKEFMKGYNQIHLKDVFEKTDLPVNAKMWCATNPIFLSPGSKSILLSDLAALIETELSKDVQNVLPILEKAVIHNGKIATNMHSNADAGDIRSQLEEQYTAAQNSNFVRDGELIDTLCQYLNQDISEGWKAAVSCYFGRAEGEELEKRRQNIIHLIEKRL